jgi:hypothetical protein
MNVEKLTSAEKALLKAARDAQSRAYAPYSKFPVGAAVLDESGRVHSGCNVENAAYPMGDCRTGAIADGARRRPRIQSLRHGRGQGLVTPCSGLPPEAARIHFRRHPVWWRIARLPSASRSGNCSPNPSGKASNHDRLASRPRDAARASRPAAHRRDPGVGMGGLPSTS